MKVMQSAVDEARVDIAAPRPGPYARDGFVVYGDQHDAPVAGDRTSQTVADVLRAVVDAF